MYEDQTFEAILSRMLKRIPDTFDKREGSIIYDTLAPAAIELEREYKMLDYNLQQQNPLTADREHLIEYGSTYGLSPVPASCAILEAEFIMEPSVRKVSVGSRFMQGDLTFVVTERIGDTTYHIQCEQPGEAGNNATGLIQPIYNINGLRRAEIIGIAIPGEDDEDTEQFRQRYIDYFQDKAFGGNMAQYRQEIMKIPGVGGVKIIRHFQDNDFWIGVILLDSRYQKPTDETVAYVQEYIHPLLPDYEQATIENSGDGFAPIGHVVIVQAVRERTVNIKLHIDYKSGFSFESVQEEISNRIAEYFTELSTQWADRDNIVVRTSGIEVKILDIPGVVDCWDTELNNERSNIDLDFDEIPILGTIEEY